MPQLVVSTVAPPRSTRLRPLELLVWSLAALLVGNLDRIPVLSAGQHALPIVGNDIALALVVLAGFTAVVQARAVTMDRVLLAALVFAAVGGASAVAAVPRFGMPRTSLIVALAYLARWLFYTMIYAVVINCGKASDVPRLWRAIESMSLVFAAFGVVQAALLPGFAQLVQPDGHWDLQGHRLVSTVLDPNIAGAMLLIPLLVELAMIASGARVSRWKPLLLTLAVAVTISRSALLALFVGGLVVLAARGLSRRLLRFTAGILILTVPTLPLLISFAARYGKFDPNGSAAARLVTWALALRAFADHPLIGIGFNTWSFYQNRYGAIPDTPAAYSTDGGILFLAALTGIFGLCAYLWMVSSLVARCRRIWRDAGASPPERGLAIGVVASTVAIYVDSIFLNSMFSNFVMELVWIVWGLTFLVARDLAARADGSTASEPRIEAGADMLTTLRIS